ncbi:IPExxxVDY family protein [Flavobacterium sp. RSSA_27]|uniref:IPExxxVDY family protein n=1 Tax=Flavobacterium sp. RSSA_27 TaxID=3447667 RepID=UPI003F2CE4FF
MAVHKVSLDEFEEIEYSIIAIHTPLEDYRLAYTLNLILELNLSRSAKDILIDIKEGKSFFSKYTFYDCKKDITWHLIQNKNEVTQRNNKKKATLFFDQNLEIPAQTYLLPELKKADFFLKIEACHNNFNVTKTVAKMNTIATINMVYSVKTETIKSKNNLIF